MVSDEDAPSQSPQTSPHRRKTVEVKMFFDHFEECPRCHKTLKVYYSRYEPVTRVLEYCRECNKTKKGRIINGKVEYYGSR